MRTRDSKPAADVAIIGGGFSGALCALHMSAAQPDLRISIIERGPRLGPGLAYGACAPEHLLNVPVNRLGIGLEPSFESWVREHADPAVLTQALEESGGKLGDAFVPRLLFGDYLEDLVKRLLARGQVRWLRGDAVAFLDGHKRGVLLADGRAVEARSVILALGNQTPSPPDGSLSELQNLPEYIGDPWSPTATAAIAADDPVTIIGAGLTMIDVVLMLRGQGHRGRITAFSRRGLLPRVHAFGGQWPPFPERLVRTSPATMTRNVRREVEHAIVQGVPWQRVIDAIRPAIADIWANWNMAERQRFLRHLRPYWDIFRHRMPRRVADAIEALRASGDLEIVAGRLRGYSHVDDGVELRISRARGGDDTLNTRHIINCTGPRTDFSVLSSPIILDARRKRLIKADEFGLGIETDACAVIDENGAMSDWLYAIGPLTRPAWWEITAAPEINAQIGRLAASFAPPGAVRAPAAGSIHDFGWEI